MTPDKEAQEFYENWLTEHSCQKSGHDRFVQEDFGGRHKVTCAKCGYWWEPQR